MARCYQGHIIPEGELSCEHGHTAYDGSASVADRDQQRVISQLLLQMVELQRENIALRREDAPNRSGVSNIKKPDRPEIGPDSSDNDWALFSDAWSRYKEMCRLSDPTEIRNELRSACSPEVNRLLFDLVGADILNSTTEGQLMAYIKSVAVKGLHKEVHRQTFHSMRQAEGESVTRFLARLRSQANFCTFVVSCVDTESCGRQVSYAEDMISGQLIAGLSNSDHQSKLLAEAATFITLQQKFDKLVSLESSDKSTTRLHDGASLLTLSYAQRSEYRRRQLSLQRERDNYMTPSDEIPCAGCGKVSHPGKSRSRKDCPAINMICHRCGIKGHMKKVCRKPKVYSTSGSAQTKAEGEGSNMFAHTSTRASGKKMRRSRSRSAQVVVPHLTWNGKRFQENPPEPPPTLKVAITVLHREHNAFGRTKTGPVSHSDHHIFAFADTGAQTCSSGPEIQKVLGCPDEYLVPTSHRIRGITENQLQVKGILMVQIRVGSKVTRQVVYVSKNTSGFYLSETALKELCLLPPNFPAHASQHNSSTSAEEEIPCKCPHRTTVPPRPTVIPFHPTEANKDRLKQWILEHFKCSAFNTCPHQELQAMTGKPLGVTFNPDAVPVAVHTPIPVPHHWKRKVKEDIDRDVALGIIEPVPVGTPTTWCSRMVVAPKKNGSPRRTVDLQKLNAATMRETHHTPSPFNQVSVVPAHKKKTVLDAWNGYHSLLLSPEARDATTFITEWGRYRYLRAPQGFHASGDGYTRRFDDITVDVTRKTRCIDDSLLWDDTIESAFWHTVDYIRHCGLSGIVFNPDKFHFAEDEVEFAGFTITADGVKPTKKMIEAILDFPTPTNITGVRSWFGLVNQVSYAFSQAKVMAPFRDLLGSKDRKFYWDDQLECLFEQSKQIIARKIENGVKTFEINRATCLSTDFSRTGIGYFLYQKHCSCPVDAGPNCGNDHWRLILAGSRFTKDAETRYAPVEGEALALVYGLESCRMFVLGCPDLLVTVDHQPLTKIFSNQALEKITNPRLFNFKERSLMYKFRIKHIPGMLNTAPDCISRYPVSTSSNIDAAQPIDSAIGAAFGLMCIHDPKFRAITWERVVEAAASDQECKMLVVQIQQGFPVLRQDLPPAIRQFWPMREDLYCLEGVPIKDNKILIPRQLRAEVLESLHSAHQGVNGMLANAKQRLFWPGLDASIRQTRAQCATCNSIAPSQPREPLTPPPNPEFPFQQTVTDFFNLNGRNYMVYADRYTGWVEVAFMTSGKAKLVCDTLRTWFCTYGAPEELSSDGGPPFDSQEYNSFLANWGIRKRISSAYYPQSNGRAELAVKTAKRILADNTDSCGRLNHDRAARALLTHRNTPVIDLEMSPAMMLYGRAIKDHLPILREKYQIRHQWREIGTLREAAMAKRHVQNIKFYNAHSRTLQELKVGDAVQLQNQDGPYPHRWTKTGRIVESLGHRQYRVRIDGSNRITLRNRRFLRKIVPVIVAPYYPTPEGAPPIHMPSSPQLDHGDNQDNLVRSTPATVETLASPRPPPAYQSTPVSRQPSGVPRASPDTPSPDRCPTPVMNARQPSPAAEKTCHSPPEVQAPRHSTRLRRPPQILSPRMRGPSHKYSAIN